MTRPKKHTIDYFPHSTKHGKTIFIIEERYGNDGYAFWFKLLETLGNTENHFLDLNDSANFEYLRSITRSDDVFVVEILDLLSKLNAIDPVLWQSKVVWCQNFIDGISDVYTGSRHTLPPTKPDNYATKPRVDGISTQDNPQSKVKESKINKTLCVYSNAFQSFWDEYPKHTSKKAAFKEFESSLNKPSIDAILVALRAQKRNKAELHTAGQFCPEWPDPERWIKKERWNDESIKITAGGNGSGKGFNANQRNFGANRELSQEAIDTADEINRKYYAAKAAASSNTGEVPKRDN